jgi:spore germination protein KA
MRLRQLQMQNQKSPKEDGKNEKKAQPKFTQDLEHNLSILRGIVGTSNDIITRRFTFGNETRVELALIFIDGLADKTVIQENIIKPLMSERHFTVSNDDESDPIIHMRTALLSVGSVEQAVSIYQAVDGILSGDSVLLADGSIEFLVISTRGWETRSIEEPKTESVVRGPRTPDTLV